MRRFLVPFQQHISNLLAKRNNVSKIRRKSIHSNNQSYNCLFTSHACYRILPNKNQDLNILNYIYEEIQENPSIKSLKPRS